MVAESRRLPQPLQVKQFWCHGWSLPGPQTLSAAYTFLLQRPHVSFITVTGVDEVGDWNLFLFVDGIGEPLSLFGATEKAAEILFDLLVDGEPLDNDETEWFESVIDPAAPPAYPYPFGPNKFA